MAQSPDPAGSAAREPRRVEVLVRDGQPAEVGRHTVAEIVETWRVLDRWWTEQPVELSYFDVRLDNATRMVVMRRGVEWFDVTEAKAHA